MEQDDLGKQMSQIYHDPLRLDPVNENRKLFQEWKKFIAGDVNIDQTVVPRPILDDWTQCRSLNLSPRGIPQIKMMTGADLKRLLDENRDFIETCRPFLTKLFDCIRNFSFAVGLFDPNGYLLNIVQEDRFRQYNMLFNFIVGACWTQEYAGNTSLSYVLKRKQPRQIAGTQHYLKAMHFITASCAPIMNPNHELIGCIVISTLYTEKHPHTLGMAIAAAQAIENEFKARDAMARCQAAFDETDIATSLQKAIIRSIPEPLIALNAQGQITAINEQARTLCGLDNGNVMGFLLTDMYPGEENRAFLDLVSDHDSLTDTEVRIRLPRGATDFTLTLNPILSSGGAMVGKILIISEIKRIKSLIANYIGTQASFHFKDICTQNRHFIIVLDHAARMAQSASNILLLGESGTGKDLISQAIHNASPRKKEPYVAINCAAIPRDLISSELFGHSEGAFTGSRRGGSRGKFELADGGTIFLDEIAEIPLEIQAVLLRVLEDKAVVRIGSSRIRTVDIRIISATNKDLLTEVKKGTFRKDLYYRLNVFNIQIPPLRERLDDIPLLVSAFIRKYASAIDKHITRADDSVLQMFMQHPWPGNVRELQNVVERMVHYVKSDTLTLDGVPPEIIDPNRPDKPYFDLESPEESEKRLLRHLITLKIHRNQIARQTHMSRATLYRKIKKYGLTELLDE